MGCLKGCGNGSGGAGGGTSVQNITFNESNQETESVTEKPQTGIPFPVAFTAEQAQNKLLTKGTYQIEGIIQNPNRIQETKRNIPIFVPVDGTQKKVIVKRLEIGRADMIDSEYVSNYRATVEVIENPIPIAAVVYGLSAIGSLTAGWFFVDKVEKFTSTGIGGLLSGFAAAAVIYTIVFK